MASVSDVVEAIPPTPRRVLVWDLPLRLFHWLLVVAVVVAGVTGRLGGSWLRWHERAGDAVLGLVVFRLLWGVLGSTHARFADFLPSPARLRAFVGGRWTGVGHTPLGALAMLAILAVSGAQAVTGLFSNDDIDYQGPLAALLSGEASNVATWLHQGFFSGLAALVALHLLAIAYHTWFERQRLVGPMVTGYKLVHGSLPVAHEGGGVARFVLAASLAAALAWTAGSGWLAEALAPPPPPVSGAPAPAAW